MKILNTCKDSSSKEANSDVLASIGGDGWSETVSRILYKPLAEAEDLIYEVQQNDSISRGSYTNCETNKELSQYLKDLAEKLTDAADKIAAL